MNRRKEKQGNAASVEELCRELAEIGLVSKHK
jgi:hypothetical protein